MSGFRSIYHYANGQFIWEISLFWGGCLGEEKMFIILQQVWICLVDYKYILDDYLLHSQETKCCLCVLVLAWHLNTITYHPGHHKSSNNHASHRKQTSIYDSVMIYTHFALIRTLQAPSIPPCGSIDPKISAFPKSERFLCKNVFHKKSLQSHVYFCTKKKIMVEIGSIHIHLDEDEYTKVGFKKWSQLWPNRTNTYRIGRVLPGIIIFFFTSK